MTKIFTIIKLPHGYSEGAIKCEPETSPTIDTGIGNWHTLIGEITMNEIICIDMYNKSIKDTDIIGTILTNTELGKCGVWTIGEPSGIFLHESEARRGKPLDGVANTQRVGKSSAGVIIPMNNNQDIKCKQIAQVYGKSYNETSGRVYDENGLSPTIKTFCGGGQETKIGENKDFDFKIRKLTPKECARLMGVKDKDSNQIANVLSKSAQYHCYGDSIVTSCLMAIFGKMFDIDYETKIKELASELKEK